MCIKMLFICYAILTDSVFLSFVVVETGFLCVMFVTQVTVESLTVLMHVLHMLFERFVIIEFQSTFRTLYLPTLATDFQMMSKMRAACVRFFKTFSTHVISFVLVGVDMSFIVTSIVGSVTATLLQTFETKFLEE